MYTTSERRSIVATPSCVYLYLPVLVLVSWDPGFLLAPINHNPSFGFLRLIEHGDLKHTMMDSAISTIGPVIPEEGTTASFRESSLHITFSILCESGLILMY